MWVITDKIADSPPWLHMQKLCQCLMLCLKVTMRWSVQLAYIYQNRMKIVQIMDSMWGQIVSVRSELHSEGSALILSTVAQPTEVKYSLKEFPIDSSSWLYTEWLCWFFYVSYGFPQVAWKIMLAIWSRTNSLSANLILHLISRLWFLKPERIVRSLCQFLPFASCSF